MSWKKIHIDIKKLATFPAMSQISQVYHMSYQLQHLGGAASNRCSSENNTLQASAYLNCSKAAFNSPFRNWSMPSCQVASAGVASRVGGMVPGGSSLVIPTTKIRKKMG